MNSGKLPEFRITGIQFTGIHRNSRIPVCPIKFTVYGDLEGDLDGDLDGDRSVISAYLGLFHSELFLLILAQHNASKLLVTQGLSLGYKVSQQSNINNQNVRGRINWKAENLKDLNFEMY